MIQPSLSLSPVQVTGDAEPDPRLEPGDHHFEDDRLAKATSSSPRPFFFVDLRRFVVAAACEAECMGGRDALSGMASSAPEGAVA